MSPVHQLLFLLQVHIAVTCFLKTILYFEADHIFCNIIQNADHRTLFLGTYLEALPKL